MKRAALVLLLAALTPSWANAQAPAAAAPAPAPASAPAPTPESPAPPAPREVKITNRSSFSLDGPTKRSPFLPIGYVRFVKEAPREAIPDVRAEMFTVSAILLGDPPLAIINGKDRGVGDRIPVNASGTEFVIVRRISDGQVTLDHRGRPIVVNAGRKR